MRSNTHRSDISRVRNGFVALILRLSIVDRARLNGDATLREEIARRVVRVLSALLEKRRISSFPFSLIELRIRFARFQLGIVAEFAF